MKQKSPPKQDKKLTTEQKVNMVVSRPISLREIAKSHDVHHSTIDGIFKESENLLSDYWAEKSTRVGRPPNARDETTGERAHLEQENESLKNELALRQMRIDYLELKLKWEHERALEDQRNVQKHLKKKKR